MIRLKRIANLIDAVPCAIFWRSVRYFSNYVRTEIDDLDEYEVASYAFGNECQFDLRRYRGHPPLTTSLYLDASFGIRESSGFVRSIIRNMEIPNRVVAWKVGQRIVEEDLQRTNGDRLREDEARILALKIASRRQNGCVATAEIKREIPRLYALSPLDLAPSTTRPQEQRWQQIVGNVISHQGSPHSLFQRELAVRTHDGLQITQQGRDYLNNIGFSV